MKVHRKGHIKIRPKTVSSDEIRCPKCLSTEVRYAKRRFWDPILELFLHWEVFRCRKCRHRFHEYVSDKE